MASTANALASPKVIVALDFGTTFSGFAYAHTTEPAKIYSCYDYPRSGKEKPYCKTLTASYYKQVGGEWELKAWGYPARSEYERDVQALRKHRAKGLPLDDPAAPTMGKYLTRFKLHLASHDMGVSSASPLPVGLTAEVVIADYLCGMGDVILAHLQRKYGEHLTMEVIQWCITVPSIWDDSAKVKMRSCMIDAGLVKCEGGSPHPLIVVLEPEAASFHCHKVMKEQILDVGDKLLVADIGGGTSDIVVQEVVSVGEDSRYRVKEVTTSSGGLCGGTYVDSRFMEFLQKQIGPCLPECIVTHPHVYAQLLKAWECAKTSFGEPTMIGESIEVDFPNSLAAVWQAYDQRVGNPARDSYDSLEITYPELQSIFDPVVTQIRDLISNQLLESGGAIKVLVVVGGFAESPYLLDCIRRKFSDTVPHIFSPPNPGSAVSQGAVALAFNPDIIVSRICKRTYGFAIREHFETGVDPIEYLLTCDGYAECRNRFRILVRKGDEVRVDDCVSTTCSASFKSKRTTFRLFSTYETDPRYTTEDSVMEEGEFCVTDVSAGEVLRRDRRLKVSLFFGGSSIEVKAEAVNFLADDKVGFPIEVDYLLNRS
ncbi:hypothetical protein M758_6G035900 [Ceratodon purpureus]|nr:hypothetical protein M758_6G035900 [Ceratodon purpureus]